jgi:hypothetical protein
MNQPCDPPAPIIKHGAVSRVGRLRRDSPVSGPTLQVGTPGAPPRSYGYAFVAPPWIRGCRVRNATRQGFSAAS